MSTKVAVQQTEEVIEANVLAENIVKIGAGFENLQKGGLNKRAIIVLLHDLTGVPKKQIIAVLDGIRDLKKNYTI